MKLSTDIPDDWGILLRQAAAAAGAQSVQDFVRAVLAEKLGVDKPGKTWGGKRQVEQETQDAPLDKETGE